MKCIKEKCKFYELHGLIKNKSVCHICKYTFTTNLDIDCDIDVEIKKLEKELKKMVWYVEVIKQNQKQEE